MSIRHTGSTDEVVSPPLQGYMRPLKQPDSSSIVDPLLVDDMFYQIPEILEHHELFLEEVAACVGQWHHTQTVGHILIQSVSSTDTAQLSGVKKNQHCFGCCCGFAIAAFLLEWFAFAVFSFLVSV